MAKKKSTKGQTTILQLQLQSGYLVTSASRHLTKNYIYTRAQQSLKVKKKQHIYTVQVYGTLEYSLDCHLECVQVRDGYHRRWQLVPQDDLLPSFFLPFLLLYILRRITILSECHFFFILPVAVTMSLSFPMSNTMLLIISITNCHSR